MCDRPLLPGPSADIHHWVPKSQGGRTTPDNTALMHRVCHKKLHVLFSERELAAVGNDPGVLRAHPQVASFVQWLRNKPGDFFARTRRPRAG